MASRTLPPPPPLPPPNPLPKPELAESTDSEISAVPIDAIRTVCTWLSSRDLARFCLAHRAAAHCVDAAFIQSRACTSGVAVDGVGPNLEVLALHEALSE